MTDDPVLIAYSAKRSRDGQRTIWKRIGAAYPHDSGAGLTVTLDVIPLDGRIILLEPDADDDRRLLTMAARNACKKIKRTTKEGR